VVNDLLQRLASAKVFTKIDLRGAYNLVRVQKGGEWKTAFTCKYGHFEYHVMPFGLKNTPAACQRLMHDVFWDYLDQFIVVYLHDILIFSEKLTEHDRHVRMVLQKLREHGLFAKLEKCAFGVKEVKFLGHIVGIQGIAMDPAKTRL
jgi:hypothetical protein